MAYTITTPQMGWVQIANIDAGFLPPSTVSSGSTTTVPTPPLSPGMVVEANDPTYGVGEFILLAGVASTAIGSVVTYNTLSYATTLALAGTNLPQPIAIAMSANTSATNWGWYQISGMAVVKKTAGVTFTAATAVGVTATGIMGASATGAEVQGALVAVAAATGDTTMSVVINRPHMQGRIT